MRTAAAGVALCLVILGGCDQAQTTAPAGSPSPGSSDGLSRPSSPASPSDPLATATPEDPTEAVPAADLILADVASGVIDEPTGLLYRVYAAFGDARLPDQYRAGGPAEDRAAMREAVRSLGSLPPAIADELRPFLVRPTDPVSVFARPAGAARLPGSVTLASFGGRAATRSGGAAAPATVVCNPVSGWGYALGTAPFKVWGECGNPATDADVLLVAAMVEELWDAEAEFLDRQPLPDNGTPDPDEWLNDEGGDSRVDIYIVDHCVTRGGDCHTIDADTLASAIENPSTATVKGVGVASSFVIAPRGGLADPLRFRSSLAHELFHVFQSSMNSDGVWDQRAGEYHWFVEASAKWAQWHFVPASAPTSVTPFFRAFQRSPYQLSSTARDNEYASFTWPLFMEQERGPTSIARAWQAIEGQPDLPSASRAIDGQLPFRDGFRVFATRAWNEQLGVGAPIEPLLPAPPSAADRPKPSGPVRRWDDEVLLPSLPRAGLTLSFNETLPSLLMHYAFFSVDPDVGQLILDFGGLAPSAALDVDALVKIRDKGWERRELPPRKTTWCMDNADDDVEELVIVLSNHDIDPNVLVTGAWTVESPIEPCLSYEVTITWTDVYNRIDDTFEFHGWADTIDRDLSTDTAIVLTGTGTLTGERPGWASCNPGYPGIPSGSGKAEFVATVIGEEVTIGAFAALESTAFGVGTQPFTVPRKGGTVSIQSRPANLAALCPHEWHGTLTATLKIKPPPGP